MYANIIKFKSFLKNVLIKQATTKKFDILHNFLSKTSAPTWSKKNPTNYNLEWRNYKFRCINTYIFLIKMASN